MVERMLPFLLPGLIYGIGALGLSLSLRYLLFPDFTVLASVMVGGVACVRVTNAAGPTCGIAAGLFAGACAGAITGLLIHHLRVHRVLAGIITFTASRSIGYMLTKGGTADLTGISFLSPTFAAQDLLTVALCSAFLCVFASILIRTNYGSLLLAMTASKPFLTLRHRDQGKVIIGTLICANALVGLAGALYALKEHSAQVISHADFLPFTLAAIFAGNAVLRCVSRKVSTCGPGGELDDSCASCTRSARRSFLNYLSLERDDSTRIGFLFAAYVLGCVFITVLSGLVNVNAFIIINRNLSVPSYLQYLVVAVLMVLFISWSGSEQEE